MTAKVRRSTFAVLVLVAITGVAACGGGDSRGGSVKTSFRTISTGKVSVGSEVPYPPFEFGRAPHYQGFDVDLVNEVAKRLGVEARFVDTSFNPILRNLARGKFDMVASAATITPERRKTVDFSAPYFPADQALTVKTGSPVTSLEDLKGKRVGAQLGTTGAVYANKRTQAATVRTYQQIDDAFNALEAGQIDGVVHDFSVSKFKERSRRDLRVVETIPTGDQYGFAFAKDNPTLRHAVDEAIFDIKSDGAYEKLYRKWFGTDPPRSILEPGNGS